MKPFFLNLDYDLEHSEFKKQIQMVKDNQPKEQKNNYVKSDRLKYFMKALSPHIHFSTNQKNNFLLAAKEFDLEKSIVNAFFEKEKWPDFKNGEKYKQVHELLRNLLQNVQKKDPDFSKDCLRILFKHYEIIQNPYFWKICLEELPSKKKGKIILNQLVKRLKDDAIDKQYRFTDLMNLIQPHMNKHEKRRLFKIMVFFQIYYIPNYKQKVSPKHLPLIEKAIEYHQKQKREYETEVLREVSISLEKKILNAKNKSQIKVKTL